MKKKLFIEYTGAKPMCECGKEGIVRLPYYANRKQASKEVYISCNSCFSKTWAGSY